MPSGESPLNRDRIAERGARLARRDDREYSAYLREEQRRQPGCPARDVVPVQRRHATRSGCPREDELLDVLQTSRWPDGCDAALREHTASCASCADLVAVVAPLLDEHRTLVQEASVPSSAVVWWRAQMRSRREAAARAAQPISFVFGIAVACAAGLLATALGIFVPTFRKAFVWMAETTVPWPGLPIPADPLTNPVVLGFIAALALCALVAPVALYFTLRED